MVLPHILMRVLLATVFIPQSGDLLFQDIDCGPMCTAIEEVTTGIDGARFSHVGIVVETENGLAVLEAISAGVVVTPLQEFLYRSTDSVGNPKVLAGRLKLPYEKYIPGALEIMEQFVGSPYDTVFDIKNKAYYCSELIYFGFAGATGDSAFFRLKPMTFKSPGSSDFFPEWKDYFDLLDIEIPEGEPGLNPGGISLSDRIEIVHVYGYPDGYKP